MEAMRAVQTWIETSQSHLTSPVNGVVRLLGFLGRSMEIMALEGTLKLYKVQFKWIIDSPLLSVRLIAECP